MTIIPLHSYAAGRWFAPSGDIATLRSAVTGDPIAEIGSAGLNPRSDIAGLNLAQYPSILVELGNMKNPVDSALMKTPEGRQKYADAVVRGIAGFLATS
mgnify:CR=1 FL=1